MRYGNREKYQEASIIVGLFLSAVAVAAASSPTIREASASLQGKSQCVAFNWISDKPESPRGAISVPIVINGKTLSVQLDTGADATILYGGLADREGWTKSTQKFFTSTDFFIGSTRIDRPKVYAGREMKPDAKLTGTLGLPALVGRVAVLDYPGRRFCLFAEADLPQELARISYVSADLRHAKLFLPVTVGDYHSDAMVFDTGSSEMPLNVDRTIWTKLTGRADTEGAPSTIKGFTWGKPAAWMGAPAATSMTIGSIDVGTPTIFVNPAKPTAFAEWPFESDGVIGNASLWNGIVVLDLTAKIRFGYVQ